MASKHASSSSKFRGTVLQRGKACIRCRRRKMKCDGARPVCTPCIEANRIEDCEYTDNQGITRTQMLEENVVRLESRLRELEGSVDSDQQLVLRDPYESRSRPPTDRDARPEPFIFDPQHAECSWAAIAEVPEQIVQTLISIFLPYCRTVGFAIDPIRFKEHAKFSTSGNERPHFALFNAVYLWALRISNSLELRQYENVYLQRAIAALQDTSETQLEFLRDRNAARRRVEAVQAEILIAQYFFCLGHKIEGRYHANAAVALAHSCSLHQTRTFGESLRSSEGSRSSLFTSMVSLSPPGDVNEGTERIRVFWAAFDLDACWSTGLETPRSFSDDAAQGTQIDTPWSEGFQGGRTVQRFLSGYSGHENRDSYTVLRSKASALYGSAAAVAGQTNPPAFVEEVQRLARITAEFAGSLPRLDELDTVRDDDRLIMAVVHSLTHASMIHLHRAVLVAAQGTSPARLPHAEEILAILEFVYNIKLRSDEAMQNIILDPILAVCGSTAGRVLIEELDHSNCGPRTHDTLSQQRRLRSNIERLIDVLRRCAGFTDVYPVFSQHANIVEDQLPSELLRELDIESI